MMVGAQHSSESGESILKKISSFVANTKDAIHMFVEEEDMNKWHTDIYERCSGRKEAENGNR